MCSYFTMIWCLVYQFWGGHGMLFHSRNSSLFNFWQYCWMVSSSIYFSLLAWLYAIGMLLMDLIWLTCLSIIFMLALSQSPSFSIHFACFPVLPPCPPCTSRVLSPFCIYSSVGFISLCLLHGLSQPLGHMVQVVKRRILKSEFDITYQNINLIKLLDFWHFAFKLSKMRAFFLQGSCKNWWVNKKRQCELLWSHFKVCLWISKRGDDDENDKNCLFPDLLSLLVLRSTCNIFCIHGEMVIIFIYVMAAFFWCLFLWSFHSSPDVFLVTCLCRSQTDSF